MIFSEPTPINISFKGERDYLRSSDIYKEFLKMTPKFSSFEMLIFKKMVGELSFIPVAINAKKSNYAAMIYYQADGADYAIAVEEDPVHKVTLRRPYDEMTAIQGYQLNESECSINLLPSDKESTAMDYIVALNKKLLQATISKETKWAFTRLELNQPLFVGEIQIKLLKNIGVRLTKSSIEINHKPIGYIYFSDFSKAYQ